MNIRLSREQKPGAFSISALSANAVRFVGLLPVAALVMAVGTTIFAGYQLQQVVLDRHNTVQYSVAKTPVTAAELTRIAQRLAGLNPALTIESAQGKLSIIAANKGHYAEFLYALATLPAIEQQVVWEMPLLCISECGSKATFQADLRGYRQQIQTSQ